MLRHVTPRTCGYGAKGIPLRNMRSGLDVGIAAHEEPLGSQLAARIQTHDCAKETENDEAMSFERGDCWITRAYRTWLLGITIWKGLRRKLSRDQSEGTPHNGPGQLDVR